MTERCRPLRAVGCHCASLADVDLKPAAVSGHSTENVNLACLTGRYAAGSGHWMQDIDGRQPATIGRPEDCSKAAIRFKAHSEPVIQSKPTAIKSTCLDLCRDGRSA